MKENIISVIEYFIKERIENNREITPQRTGIQEELIEARTQADHSYITEKQLIYSLDNIGKWSNIK